MKNGKYTLIKASHEYPGKKYRGRYVYEHIFVWWENTGIIPPIGYHIHHKNNIKTDNRFENLEMIEGKTHSFLHGLRSNKMIPLVCGYCYEPFQRERRNVLTKKKQGQARFYCCRSHQVIDQQRRMKMKK